jgi:hypothetical protein
VAAVEREALGSPAEDVAAWAEGPRLAARPIAEARASKDGMKSAHRLVKVAWETQEASPPILIWKTLQLFAHKGTKLTKLS